jgi:hypothetical protein
MNGRILTTHAGSQPRPAAASATARLAKGSG